MSERPVYRFSHQAMGTYFEVFIAGQDEDYSRGAARAFFKEIDRLERLFSRFDPSSELSMINRLRSGESLMVGVETYECLKLSFELMRETGDAFNINFRAVKGKGESMAPGKDEARVQESGEEAGSKQSADLKASSSRVIFSGETESKEFWLKLFPLELAQTENGYFAFRLDVPDAGLDLDLGAIGKGYALEKAAEIFKDWEIDDFLVNAGQSTVYGQGKEPWPVAVGGGFDFFKPGRIFLQRRALSGSGKEVKGEHIFDPRRNRARSEHLAVWVSHLSPTLSDSLSTAFMVMSLDEIRSYVAEHAEVWTLVLTRDKNSYLFNPMDSYEQG
jgi:thiamine biosynthesis lipoprotein